MKFFINLKIFREKNKRQFMKLLCYIIMLMSPLSLLWLFDPISVENRIWGDRNETCWCDADGSRLCPVRCWKPVASYHTQI
jgi:hypothetical protein